MALFRLPGLIDPHVHLRDPGQTHKEDFFSGTTAALSGGFTTILDMPNNKIAITTEQLLKEKIAIAKGSIVADVGFYFGSMGDNLNEFPKVVDKVFGLKLYLNQTTGNLLINKNKLKSIFSAWGKTVRHLPILVHAENESLRSVLDVVKETKQNVHVCHVSTQADLALILREKESRLPISCGVTPHHLFLTEHDANVLGPFGKMKPPLAKRKDVDFLWKNLKAIDVVESDHAPHTRKEKLETTFGVTGLETTLPLLLTAVWEKRLNIDDIVRLCVTNPARIFGCQTDPNTHIEVDQSISYTIENRKLYTKCGWSPFANWRVKGKVRRVILRGKKVFEDGKGISVAKGSGRIIFPVPCAD